MAQKKLKKQNVKHYNKGLKKIALVIVLILIVLIILSNNNVSNIKYENTQIIIDNVNVTDKLQDEIIIENGKIYMSINDLKNFFDETIYKEDTGLIITSSNSKVATFSLEDEDYITINGTQKKVQNPVIKQNELEYILISELGNVYNYELKYIDDTNILTIDRLNKECIKATTKKDIKVKQKKGILSKNIEKLEKGSEVIVIGEEKQNTKIRTQKGNIGYVKTKNLENFVTERENLEEVKNKEIKADAYEYDITSKDITTYKKREEIINLILQQTIKNDKMDVKIIYNGEDNIYFQRFKIEAVPVLQECGITVGI